MLHEVEVLLNSSGWTAEQEIGVALKSLVQFEIRLMEHNNHKTQSISVRISKIISQACNKYFSFIYSTCESIHLIISNCYTDALDIKLLTWSLIKCWYSQNPLIRQGLSHDNMSDKRECRNIESVRYRLSVSHTLKS